MIALLTCTGPATNDIGPFLGSEDERRPVAEAIVDTIGPDVAVQLVISFLKKQEPTVTASEILEGCCGKLDNIKAAQAEMRAGGQTIREENGRCRCCMYVVAPSVCAVWLQVQNWTAQYKPL